MNLKLETEFSKADFLVEVDDLKAEIDAKRPFPEDIEGRVMQKLRLDWNYNSNAIEGNKLNYGETIALLMHGITAKGKPLKDHLDIQGHNDAIDFLLSIIKEDRQISEVDIRALHKIILVQPFIVPAQTEDGAKSSKLVKIGEYKTSPNHVKTITGETHYYASPQETPAKMQELMDWFNEASNDHLIHPVVLGALFHHRFVAIHPFDDGNGRLSRLLMNLILMKKGFPPAVIKTDDRQNYYSLLSQADVGEDLPFIEYIAQRITAALRLYIKALRGEDIDEDDDVDKEIALLKIQLQGGAIAREKKSSASMETVFRETVVPVLVKLNEKSKGFYDFFFKHDSGIVFSFEEQGSIKRASFNFNQNHAGDYKLYFQKSDVAVTFFINFNEYKDPINSFSLRIALDLTFDEFYYMIRSDGAEIIRKLYHQQLTNVEESRIVKYFIANFKSQLNLKIK